VASIIICVLPLIIARCHFPFDSSKSESWGNYGDFLSGAYALITCIVVIVAAFLSYDQLKEMKNARKLDSFVGMLDLIQHEQVREGRKEIFGLYEREKKEWTEHELELKKWVEYKKLDKVKIDKALRAYNILGIMHEHELIEPYYFLHWKWSIIKTYDVLKEYIDLENKIKGEDFNKGIKELYDYCKAH
jgi:hypothetical protein